MWRRATIFSPLRSKRAMISPLRERAKASGFTRIRVRSMCSFAGGIGSGGSGAPAGTGGASRVRASFRTRARRRIGRCDRRSRGGGLGLALLGERPLELDLLLGLAGFGGRGAAAPRARATDARHVRLAVRADRPGLIERAAAVDAALLELAQAAGAADEVGLDAVVAVRAQRLVDLVQTRFGGLRLELALVDILEVLGRPQDHVGDRADEREHGGRRPAADQDRIPDPHPA